VWLPAYLSDSLFSCLISPLPGNVFSGIQNNNLFLGIWITTSILQAIIVEFGSIAFSVYEEGLDPKYWGISMALGSFSLVWQQVINFFYRCGQRYNIHKNKKRMKKYGHLTLQNINGTGPADQHPHSE
jgi:Ca2+ transporting ATPase